MKGTRRVPRVRKRMARQGQVGPVEVGDIPSRATDPRQLEVSAMEKTHSSWVGVCLEVLRS